MVTRPRMRWERTRVEALHGPELASRATCVECPWVGPIRECRRDADRVRLNIDRDEHERTCKAGRS